MNWAIIGKEVKVQFVEAKAAIGGVAWGGTGAVVGGVIGAV